MGSKALIFTLFFLLPLWHRAQDKTIELVEGTWVNTQDSTLMEIWERTGEGLQGRSIDINSEGEEEVWEFLKLSREGETWVYEVTMEEHPRPVAFRLEKHSRNSLLFSNPENDFPKYIHYKWKDNDHLHVEVYASPQGKKLEFDFRRRP